MLRGLILILIKLIESDGQGNVDREESADYNDQYKNTENYANDDGYYWSHSKGDKAIRITVTDTELHAYQIVAKYGKFVKAGIRM